MDVDVFPVTGDMDSKDADKEDEDEEGQNDEDDQEVPTSPASYKDDDGENVRAFCRDGRVCH